MEVNSAISDDWEAGDRDHVIEPSSLSLADALGALFEALSARSDTAEQTGGGDGQFQPSSQKRDDGHGLIDLELAEQPRQTREDQQGEDDDGDEVEVAHAAPISLGGVR
jgi:hypothetical protein